jgi:hypothetical protein
MNALQGEQPDTGALFTAIELRLPHRLKNTVVAAAIFPENHRALHS